MVASYLLTNSDDDMGRLIVLGVALCPNLSTTYSQDSLFRHFTAKVDIATFKVYSST